MSAAMSGLDDLQTPMTTIHVVLQVLIHEEAVRRIVSLGDLLDDLNWYDDPVGPEGMLHAITAGCVHGRNELSVDHPDLLGVDHVLVDRRSQRLHPPLPLGRVRRSPHAPIGQPT